MRRTWLVVALLLVPLLAVVARGSDEPEVQDEGPVMVAEGMYGEAPMLAALVASGDLPPVDERLPDEPYVQPVIDGIGKYGGTVNVFASYEEPYTTFQGQERGMYMLGFDEDLEIVGDVARDYELSDDFKTLTLYLREGHRWSDGEPFTAADAVFSIKGIDWKDEVTFWTVWGIEGDPFTDVVAVDDYTIRFDLAEPNSGVLLQMASWMGSTWNVVQPSHYLGQFHIDYNPDADDLAASEGFDSWAELFNEHYDHEGIVNTEKPSLAPWVIAESATGRRVYERNAFYYKVDPAGNQLPYLDSVHYQTAEQEVINLNIISGEVTIEYVGAGLENFTLFKENEDAGDYTVYPIPGAAGSDLMIAVYQNSSDPVMGPLQRDVRFRRALSMAINREEINEIVYSGLAVPRAATIISSASYFKPEWATAYAQYDPDAANALLDEIGLTERDDDGYRLSGGTRVVFPVELVVGERPIAMELVQEYWADVGVELEMRMADDALNDERLESPEHGSSVQKIYNSEEVSFYGETDYWMPDGSDAEWGTMWQPWLDANDEVTQGLRSLSDFEGGVLPGIEPPQGIKDLRGWCLDFERTVFGSPEYMELATKIFDFHADQIIYIGIVGEGASLLTASNRLGNIPRAYAPGLSAWEGELGYWATQIYFK